MNNNDRSLFKHSAMALYNSEVKGISNNGHFNVITLVSKDYYILNNGSLYSVLSKIPSNTIPIPDNLNSFIKHWQTHYKTLYIDCIEVMSYNDRILSIEGINYTSKAHTSIIDTFYDKSNSFHDKSNAITTYYSID